MPSADKVISVSSAIVVSEAPTTAMPPLEGSGNIDAAAISDTIGHVFITHWQSVKQHLRKLHLNMTRSPSPRRRFRRLLTRGRQGRSQSRAGNPRWMPA